ncbi:MAG TPA: DUF3422 domain-containing protein [Methylomirabilota bacterium]|nr:DUF3422 domain-containing protein [Methylomirabilota bacterium]
MEAPVSPGATQQVAQPPIGPTPHPWRVTLTAELHARPYAVVTAPARLFHLAVVTGEASADAERRHLGVLCSELGVAPPAGDASHFAAAFPGFRLTWERHTEFSTYTFILPAGEAEPFSASPRRALPAAWIDALAGQTIAAVHLELLDRSAPSPSPLLLERVFRSGNIIGNVAAGGRAAVWSDLDLDADGTVRLLVHDLGMSPRQTGRMAQRLLEIHTYCMTALLALPLAREIGPAVSRMERELADIAQALPAAGSPDDEQAMLKRLSALAAEVESLAARTPYRFGAARAYHALVTRRIEELREQRVEGQQTIGEFMDRRLGPAMRTCETMQQRLEHLSQRVARASEMLRTRVDVTLAAQNRDLLASMDRRAKLQLRLQQTVEGLSVAAITYYAVGLVSYLTQGVIGAGLLLPKELIVGGAVPIFAAIAWLGLRRLHRKLDDH